MEPSNNPENTILLISAQKSLIKKVSGLIKSDFPGLTLTVAENGIKGLNLIYQSPPALVLVDSTLADISGLQICRVLKHDPTIRKLPIMLITKEATREYERFSELSLIADVFLEEKSLNQHFVSNLKMLLNLYRGLADSERQQLKLLQQDSVRVQAMNRLVQLYDQSITEVALMKSFRKLFEMVPSRNVLHHMLFSIIENVLDYDAAAVFFNDNNREARLVTYHVPQNFAIKEEQFKAWTDDLIAELRPQAKETWAFKTCRHEVITPDYMDQPVKAVQLKHRSMYPFFVENTLVGALVFYNRKEVNYDLIFPFPLILQELSALMRLRRYYSEAEMLSITDSLTGLYNHQHFHWCLEREIRQAKRHRTPLTLANISVDDFKEMNVQWGHEQGDKAIVQVSAVLLDNLRNIDILSRAGTRTIMALFPNTDPEDSMIPLKRVQKCLEKNPIMVGNNPLHLKLTIGLVGLSESINSGSEFLAQAQKAVDQAREKGHSSVELLQ